MSLLSSLVNSSSALKAFDQELTVTQNNVNNASTPNYATQRMNLNPLPFDPASGVSGGVRPGELESSRNQFAEAAVMRAQTSLGTVSQQSASLTAVQNALNLSGPGGIPAALGNLFSSFSAWSQDPSSSAARNAVLDSAQQVADSFRTTTSNLQQVKQDTERQIAQAVDQINSLGAQLQDYNVQIRNGDMNDAALDAKIHTTLENLSQVVNFTSTTAPDGEVTVLVGGQTALVVGDHQYKISSRIAAPAGTSVPPSASILDSAGRDITAETTGGQLGALVGTHNRVLASLLGDASQPGQLNQLAQAFADRVNQLLTSGNVSDGPPPVAGSALFSYDTSNATNTSATLAIVPGMTPDQLAAIDPGPPYVSNGMALQLAGLANPQNAADKVSALSYVEYFGGLAAEVGRELSAAQDQQTIQQQVVAQTQSLRQQISGVSLDEQAVLLVQFQRAYEANAKLVSVLSDLTATAVNILK